jgi:hypothetical protein
MWANSLPALVEYGIACCLEWRERGFEDSLLGQFVKLQTPNPKMPAWWGNQELHDSHKSNLVRKAPDYYGKMWPNIPNNLPYVWPLG